LLPERKLPAHGVLGSVGEPTIVFATVCTKDKRGWLATPDCHDLLRQVWREAAAWRVGKYVIMPDHIHLFASPAQEDGNVAVSLEKWMAYWKSLFSRRKGDPNCRWQKSHWDRRLRKSESYAEKWEYVQNNPVRHGLVERAEDWPFQGEVFELRW
jgi:putative transposase